MESTAKAKKSKTPKKSIQQKLQLIKTKDKKPAKPEKKEEVAEASGSKLLSMEELTSKEETAARAGFKPGKLVFEKSVATAEGQS